MKALGKILCELRIGNTDVIYTASAPTSVPINCA